MSFNANRYNDIKLDNISLNGGQNNRMVQKKYLIQNASSINTTCDYIYTKSSNDQFNKLTNGNYSLTTQNGNVSLISNSTSNNAIKFNAMNGGINMNAGNSIITLGDNQPFQLDSDNISIGTSSNTSNIDMTSIDNITLSTDAITGISTDNIIWKSTNGEIILDTSPNNGNNALTIDNGGNIIINNDSSTYGYKTEIIIDDESNSFPQKNGFGIINNGYANVSPELRTIYTNSDGSNRTINTMGIYSPNDKNAKYREYTGYQYGNQIISIHGEKFDNNDIGRTIIFNDDNRQTKIINLGKIILPADNTFSTSGIILTAGGIYTGVDDKIYIVKIDSNISGNETFKWSNDGGLNWNNNLYIPISYATNKRYPLSDGVYITFNNDTGHNTGDYWTIKAKNTAIVNSNIIIDGNITNDESNGTVVVNIEDNTTNTVTSTLGAPVFSNITGNIALSRLQKFKTNTSGLTGYIGTETNNDLIFQTGGEPRFTVSADGSFGVGQDTIDARIQSNSNFNKSMLVNGNILSSNIIADNGSNVITDTSNLANNILNYQQNPVCTELNTGGYIVIYESYSINNKYDIYGDAFTANGDKLTSSFRVNKNTNNNQSHPHISKSGTITSDNYLTVWTSIIDNATIGIKGQLISNNNELQFTNDISIALVSNEKRYTPRVAGLKNGNYIISYSLYNATNNKYEICYKILNSTCDNEIKSETIIATNSNINYLYPYVIGLSDKDANKPSGFVISYLKQIFTNDKRFQIICKIFNSDGSVASNEISITDTTSAGFGKDSELSLSDSLMSLETLPDNIASNEEGGFMISYQTNYSSSVIYSDIINNGVRNVKSISGNGNGNLTSASIDNTTGIQTLSISDVNGTFLKNEKIILVSDSGNLIEKIDSISTTGSTATIILSRDPKSVNVARFDSTGSLVWRNKNVSSTPLTLDDKLSSLNSTLPEDFLRKNNNHYAYRGIPTIKSNNNDEVLISWNNGSIPSIYYQIINIKNGTNTGGEYLLGKEIIGLRQINPFISSLMTRQGISLGYVIVYNTSSMDLSKTAIYQELIGIDSYIAHFKNKQIEYVINNEGNMGLGVIKPAGTFHLKNIERKKTNNIADTCSFIMENSTNGIVTTNDNHKINFKTDDGDELARISVKYSSNYQNFMNNDLIAYFKFDENNGDVIAKDNGIFNIQSSNDSNTVGNKIQDGQLINFDINTCWVSGKINNGLKFNGIDSYVKIPKDSSVSDFVKSIDNITTDSFSISFWFKINGLYVPTDDEMDIISYGSADVGDISGGGGFFQLYFRDVDSIGSLYPCFKWAVSDGNGNTEVTTSNKINDGEWHNLIVIHNRGSSDSNIKIYLDNKSILNNNLGNYINVSKDIIDRNIYIGANTGGTNNFFRGVLDELRVFQNILTTNEIDSIWRYGNETRGQLSIQTIGNNKNFKNLGAGFTLDDTGKLLGTNLKSKVYYTLTGKIKVSNNSKTINGINTIFLTEINPGDILYIDNTDNNTEEGGIYSNILNKKEYIVNKIVSDTELIINRIIPDIATTRYFTRVSIRPSIMGLFNSNDEIKGFMDYNGDLIIGENGKSQIEYSKVEIRGSGDNGNDKNGLLITSTSNTNLNKDNGRINRIITQSQNNNDSNTVLQSMISTSHEGTGNDNKSKIQFLVNDGTANINVNDLKTPLTLHNNSIINIGQTEQIDNLLGDLHIRSQDNETCKIALFSEEPATGIYTERNEIVFYGTKSINSTYNDTRSMAKILVSNDNPNPPDEELVNGRIDLKVNNEIGSSLKGLKTRLSITSDGSVGIHNIRPNNPFTATPEYIDKSENIISATIIDYTQSSNIISFKTTDNIFNNSSNSSLLRGGSIAINDGSNLTSYIFDKGISSTLNPTQYQIKLQSGYSLSDSDNSIVGKKFNIYYPGLFVNKYGLIGIGDSSFNDNETDYHLSVSGKSLLKGELNLVSNIDVNSKDSSNIGLKSSDNGEKIQIKDDTTDGYINLISGPQNTAIIETGVSKILSWSNDSTIIVNSECTLTLPTPKLKYKGYIFTIKNISTDTITITSSVNIDESSNDITLNSQFETKQFQTDGIEWYILTASSSDSNKLTDSSKVTITAPLVDINASDHVNIDDNLKIGGNIYVGNNQSELIIYENQYDDIIFESTNNNKTFKFTANVNGTPQKDLLYIFSDDNIKHGLMVLDSGKIYFTNLLSSISSPSSGNLDISSSNLNIDSNLEANKNLKIHNNLIMNTDDISSTSASSSSRINIITDTFDSSSKSIMLSDTASNGNILYYNCNIGTYNGQMLNIFYYNGNTGGSANINFSSGNIYANSGAAQYLVFDTSGQSASLMYLDGFDTTSSGWRIINTGGSVY